MAGGKWTVVVAVAAALMTTSAADGVTGAVCATEAGAAVSYRPIDATFPLSIVDGRYLADAEGVPFLVQGDSAWSLIVQLELDELDHYLDVRRAQGFNTLLVNLIESEFADDPPRTSEGIEPFDVPGDMTTPNGEYFDHAARVIEHAAERGFLVLLTPAYLGYEGGEEGWYQTMVANGADALRQYGRFLGDRFAEHPNIVWVHGGDYLPPDDGMELVQAVADGIRERDTGHLHTAHWDPGRSGADVDVDFLDLDTTYTTSTVHVKSLEDYQRGGPPRVLIESAYEHDTHDVSDQQIRSEAYEALLTGTVGQFYGHGSVWKFDADWADSLDTSASRAMTHLRVLFDALPWPDLRPVVDGSVLVDGAGEFAEPDYAVAASTPTVSVIYVPSERSLTVRHGNDGARPEVAPSDAWWFDPTSGEAQPVREWTVNGDGTFTVSTPGANAAGDGDWVLVIGQPIPAATECGSAS